MRGLVLLAALAAASPVHAGEPPEEPRLMGIVVAGALRQAVFADGRGGSETVREGDLIGAWRVYLITPREVGLEGVAGRRLVQPGGDATFRDALVGPIPLIDPYRRETETENDQ